MKIAIISDTHNKVARTRVALAEAQRRGVAVVLHCGDIENAGVVELFAGLNAHFVFGNCDHDRAGLRRTMDTAGVTLHENFGHLELAGKKIAFVHGDDGGLLRDLENSGAYDFLFHGHTHVRAERQAGPTRVINPGALQRVAVKTFAVLDLDSGAVETVVVED
jgi:putative phosphoesterase